MRSTLSFIIALIVFVSCDLQVQGPEKELPINTIIGDISYLEKFGELPDRSTDEQLRIVTHLAYAEQLLRNKDVSELSIELQDKRAALLDLLHDYWKSGVFPTNYDKRDRRPCFIDNDGVICAVGYLVEQTAGRQAAEDISALFQYDYVVDMDVPELAEWVANSGLTIEEYAIIQPTYISKEMKNTIYIEALGSGMIASLNYERVLTTWPTTTVRAGISYNPECDSYYIIPTSVQYIHRRRRHNYIEFGMGYTFANRKVDDATSFKNTMAAENLNNAFLSFGYRKQFGNGSRIQRGLNWMWKANIMIIPNDGKLTPWMGIALGKRF